MGKYRRGPSTSVLLGLGVAMMLVGLTLGAVGALFSITPHGPTPSDKAIEVTVAKAKTIEPPVGRRIVSGWLKITGGKKTGRSFRTKQLLEERIGRRKVKVIDADGDKRSIQLPKLSYDTWLSCPAANKKVSSLEGTGVEDRVPGWDRGGHEYFYVSSPGVAPGDRLLVELGSKGKAQRMWCGTRKSVGKSQAESTTSSLWLFAGLGGGLFLFGILLLGLQFVLGRRRDKALPSQPEHAPSWVNWAMNQRSANWTGNWRGHDVVAQRAYRKYGVGPAILNIGCKTGTRVFVIVRRGARGAVGRGIDKVAGVTLEPGDRFGLPSAEVGMVDREWGEAWLARPEVRNALGQLIANSGGAEVVNFGVRPSYLGVTFAYPTSVDRATSDGWLEAMTTLAEVASQMPATAQPVEPSRLEALAMDPARAQRVAYLVVFALIAVLFVVAGLMLGVLMLLK